MNIIPEDPLIADCFLAIANALSFQSVHRFLQIFHEISPVHNGDEWSKFETLFRYLLDQTESKAKNSMQGTKIILSFPKKWRIFLELLT
jgi:hypothetical protein